MVKGSEMFGVTLGRLYLQGKIANGDCSEQIKSLALWQISRPSLMLLFFPYGKLTDFTMTLLWQ